MSGPASFKAFLRAEVRALDAQLDAGGTLELGLAAAAVRLAHPRLHRRHAAWLPEEGGTATGRGEGPSRGGAPMAGLGAGPGGPGPAPTQRAPAPSAHARPGPRPLARAHLLPRPSLRFGRPPALTATPSPRTRSGDPPGSLYAASPAPPQGLRWRRRHVGSAEILHPMTLGPRA